MKIDSIGKLKELREQLKARSALAEQKREKVFICYGGSCLASGAKAVKESLEAELAEKGLAERVELVKTGCMGPCVQGPVLLMGRDQTFYQGVAPKDAVDIVDQHIVGGRCVDRLIVHGSDGKALYPKQEQIGFFNRQEKIVLRNCGRIDPENIEDYLAEDGYQALGKALSLMSPADVIAEMETSGLRGRGGAGFPT
ncbi:MAG TPA: NADH-quinone oxidoreductase subunit F, partial [Verrucomicrobia bacterium]|nr:NADH-quinone oxidoreductase subunit F [Verrucomicrobiota bacterium]